MPSVLPLVVRTSFRFNGRFHNDRFVTILCLLQPWGGLVINFAVLKSESEYCSPTWPLEVVIIANSASLDYYQRCSNLSGELSNLLFKVAFNEESHIILLSGVYKKQQKQDTVRLNRAHR